MVKSFVQGNRSDMEIDGVLEKLEFYNELEVGSMVIKSGL